MEKQDYFMVKVNIPTSMSCDCRFDAYVAASWETNRSQMMVTSFNIDFSTV